MGREVRRVPADWQHPKDVNGYYIPLHDGYEARVCAWDKGAEMWAQGLRLNWETPASWVPIAADEAGSYEDWDGARPQANAYMPTWPEDQRTHYQMYETTSEGTPISPVFDTPEKLARWLTDNGASASGSHNASYEGWLRVARGEYAPTAAIIDGVIMSGVEAGIAVRS